VKQLQQRQLQRGAFEIGDAVQVPRELSSPKTHRIVGTTLNLFQNYMTDQWLLRVPSEIFIGLVENRRSRSMTSPQFHEA